jgi:signal transduction histidine kinase
MLVPRSTDPGEPGADGGPVREAFLAVLSHELRTPITTIYAGASVLARDARLSPPATRSLARDVSAEAARLYDLVEDLLVLARLERGLLEPGEEPVLLQRAVESAMRSAAERFSDDAVRRRGDIDPPPVVGDSTYVAQACRNLVLSSIRVGSPESSPVVVEIRRDDDRREVAVAVIDPAISLSRSDLEDAFALPARSANRPTAGLGPFVCRALVSAMGGRTWARNRPGGGLEMGFSLRMAEPD